MQQLQYYLLYVLFMMIKMVLWILIKILTIVQQKATRTTNTTKDTEFWCAGSERAQKIDVETLCTRHDTVFQSKEKDNVLTQCHFFGVGNGRKTHKNYIEKQVQKQKVQVTQVIYGCNVCIIFDLYFCFWFFYCCCLCFIWIIIVCFVCFVCFWLFFVVIMLAFIFLFGWWCWVFPCIMIFWAMHALPGFGHNSYSIYLYCSQLFPYSFWICMIDNLLNDDNVWKCQSKQHCNHLTKNILSWLGAISFDSGNLLFSQKKAITMSIVTIFTSSSMKTSIVFGLLTTKNQTWSVVLQLTIVT